MLNRKCLIISLISTGLLFSCGSKSVEVSSFDAYNFVKENYVNFGWRNAQKVNTNWDLSKSYGLGVDYAIAQIRSSLNDDTIVDLKGQKQYSDMEFSALNESNFYEICSPARSGAKYWLSGKELTYFSSTPIYVSASSQFSIQATIVFNSDGYIKNIKYNYPDTNIYDEPKSGHIEGVITLNVIY